MRALQTLLALSGLLLASTANTADAGLLFAINGTTTPGAITLTPASPTITLTISVGADSSEVFIPNQFRLDRFGFRLRSSNSTIATFSNVTLLPPPAGTFASSVAQLGGSGAFAEVQGNYTSNPAFPPQSFPPANFISLASFTLSMANSGSAVVTIEEFTSGEAFDFTSSSDAAGLNGLAAQDAQLFTGPLAGGFRTAPGSQTLSISAVPEPGSLALIASGLGIASIVRRRRKNAA